MLAYDEVAYMAGVELTIDGGILAGSSATPGGSASTCRSEFFLPTPSLAQGTLTGLQRLAARAAWRIADNGSFPPRVLVGPLRRKDDMVSEHTRQESPAELQRFVRT